MMTTKNMAVENNRGNELGTQNRTVKKKILHGDEGKSKCFVRSNVRKKLKRLF